MSVVIYAIYAAVAIGLALSPGAPDGAGFAFAQFTVAYIAVRFIAAVIADYQRVRDL